MGNKDTLCEMGYEDSIVFENPDYDDAIIGVSTDGRVVYSYDKMVESLMVEDEMTEEDAIEFVNRITVRSLGCDNEKPVVMYDLIGR